MFSSEAPEYPAPNLDLPLRRHMTLKICGATATFSLAGATALMGHQPAWLVLAVVLVVALAWLAWAWLSDGETRRQRHFAKQSPETQHALIARERAMRGIEDAVQPKRADEDA